MKTISALAVTVMLAGCVVGEGDPYTGEGEEIATAEVIDLSDAPMCEADDVLSVTTTDGQTTSSCLPTGTHDTDLDFYWCYSTPKYFYRKALTHGYVKKLNVCLNGACGVAYPYAYTVTIEGLTKIFKAPAYSLCTN